MRHKLILLVEDDDNEAELMSVALHRNGIHANVTRAKDGAEALDILLSADESVNLRFSVVFLDLNLPKVSGLEVLRRVRAQDRTRMLPIVVLSSSALEEDVRNAYLLGANSYIRKPVDFDRFSRAVNHLALYWLGLNEIPPRAGLLSVRLIQADPGPPADQVSELAQGK